MESKLASVQAEQNQPEETAKASIPNLDDFQEESTFEEYLQIVFDARSKANEYAKKLQLANEAEENAIQSFIEKMKEQGLKQLKALGKTVFLKKNVFASVLAENRDKQKEWLKEVGAGSLIVETVNAQTFSSFVNKDFIEAKNEAELPEWINVCKKDVLGGLPKKERQPK